MLVIDASAATELLLARASAQAIADHLAEHDHDLHAPALIDVEVLSALRRLVASGEASAARADDAIADLMDVRLARYRHDILVPRIWELRGTFSPCDAAYVALAESLTDAGVPLLTADRRLARSIRTHTEVDVIAV
jgi:predicted nucleic acid-binding protein